MALPILSLQPGWLGKKYKLSNDADQDVVLDRMKQLGIVGIEGGGPDPVAFKRKLDARGLKYSGTHVAMSGKPDMGKVLDYLHQVGGNYVCNSGIMEWNKPNLQHFKEGIQKVNEYARQCKAAGVYFTYHNHAFEFDKVDGDRRGMDVLIDGIDWSNDHVGLCMDVAWIWRGKDDPASFLERHADKIRYLHLKDTDDADWKELGQGKLDWASIFKVLPKLTKCAYAAIEQDQTDKDDPLVSVDISRKFLKERFGY